MSRFHDAEENREEVVKMVKSCLVLNKGGLPITELNKVYRDLVGNNVPYRVLGYPTLQDFMQSIPEVYCSGKNADGVLILNVQDDNLKHIQDLVSHQKCAKKRPTRKYESSRYSGGSFKNSYTKYGSQISNKNYGSSRQNNRAPRFSTNNSSLRKPFTQNSNYDSSNCYSAENVVQSTKREEYSSQHERQAPRCYSTNEKIETENWETPSYENRERAHDVKENYFSRHTGTKVEESCTRFANHSAVEQEILLQSRLQFINNSKASLHKSETATSKINVPYDLTSSNKYYIEKSNYKIRPIVKQLEAAQGDKYVVMAPQEKPLTSGYQNKPETSYTSGETNSITLRLPSFNIRKEEFMKSHKFNPDVVLDLLAKSPGMSVPLRPSTTSVSSNEQSQQFRNSYPPGLNLPTPSSFQMESQWFNKTSNISSDLSMSPRIQTESQHFKNMNPLPDFTHVKEPNSKFVTETPRSKNDNCPPGFLLPVQVSSHCPGTIEQTENSKNIEASNNLTNIKDSKDTECFQMTKPTFQAMPLKAPTVCMTGEQPQWFKKATPHLGVDWTRKFIKKTLASTSSTGATKSNANKISQDENLFNQDSSTLTENVCQKSKTLDEDFSDASLSKKTLNVFSQNENASSNQSEVAPIMEKLSLQVSPTPSISTDQANENVDEKVSNCEEEEISENKQGFHTLFSHQLIVDDFITKALNIPTSADNEYELCVPGLSIGDCFKKIKQIPLHTHAIVLVGNIDILEDLPMNTMKLMMKLLMKEMTSRVQRAVFLTLPPLLVQSERQHIILQKQKEFNNWLYQQIDEKTSVGDLHCMFSNEDGSARRSLYRRDFYSAPGVDESFALWNLKGRECFLDFMAECCPVHM